MKKIFYILASAIVALGAVACENEGLENVNPNNGEGLTIAANITKVAWSGVTPTWEAGDSFVIEGYTFTTADGTNFVCKTEGVHGLVGKTNVEVTFGEFNSANGLAGTVFTTTIDEIKLEGTVATFVPQNAVLQFTADLGTEITFASENLFSAAEVTVEATGKTQYVAVKAGVEGTFSYSVDGFKCKEKAGFTATAAKFYDLGILWKKSTYNVVGSFQGWDVSAANAVPMYTIADGWSVAKGVELYKTDEFKIVKGNTWTTSYGFATAGVLKVDTETAVQTSNSQNMKAAKNGKFDIYFNGSNKVKYVCAQEYTGTVNITLNNEANWNPVYITLKSGSTTIANNAPVSNNTYAVSMDYIGESLSYTISDGTKTLKGNVPITKDGATINVVESFIKLVFQLNKQNSRDYWGNTAKIHIWNSDASIATSWPGMTMTFDGNYTWHYDIPASLAGTKMSFLIHNGNGWQSQNEPTITLSAEGHTFTDADDSMKIN